MHVFVALLFSTLILGGLASSVPAFDFDDLERLEKAEQEELLAKAGQAACDWNFSTARSLLKQAQQKGYAPAEIQAAEKLIAQNESAKADQDRRAEEKRRAQIAAQEAERQAQIAAQEAERQQASMAQNRSTSSSGGGGQSSNRATIDVSCQSPGCSIENVRISPASGSNAGHGRFESVGLYGIFKGSDGRFDGVYTYTVTLKPYGLRSKACSGSFSLSGRENTFYLKLTTDCRDAGSSGY